MAPTMNRTLRLPREQFFPADGPKTGIAIHHTVGGSARSTFDYWKGNPDVVGTAYIIERDGTIFEVFDSGAWAFQFGLPWPGATRIQFEKRFIGIELASEGALIERDGNLYCFDKVSDRTRKNRTEAFDYGKPFRGYRYFDKYDPPQIDALCALVDHLCTTYAIPRVFPGRPLEFYGPPLKDFRGIIGHTMVRQDKSDPLPDVALWDRLKRDCRLAADATIAPEGVSPTKVTATEIAAIATANAQAISTMNAGAVPFLTGLMQEIAKADRATIARLRNPVAGGLAVGYEMAQGDPKLVMRIARVLGFKDATESRLTAR